MLREELRKVQSSAALLERQRNPGVGYWSSIGRHDNSSEARLPSSPSGSDIMSLSRAASPPLVKNTDEEINLEYLRNVILQFLEHKEMRVSHALNSFVLLALIILQRRTLSKCFRSSYTSLLKKRDG